MIGIHETRQRFQYYQDPVIVTIASGAAVSEQIEIRNLFARGLAVLVRGPWTAADIGIEVSMNGGTAGTWTPLYDQGVPVRITNVSATVRLLYITPAEAWAIMRYNFVRLKSVATTTPYAAVNQGGTRTLEVSVLA